MEHVYTSEDIRKAVYSILDRARNIFDATGIEVEACSNYTATPDIFAGYNDVKLEKSAARIIGSAVLAPIVCGTWTDRAYLIPGVIPV
jgi:hypothetical protein